MLAGTGVLGGGGKRETVCNVPLPLLAAKIGSGVNLFNVSLPGEVGVIRE